MSDQRRGFAEAGSWRRFDRTPSNTLDAGVLEGMSFLYGAALLFAILGTGLLDFRHRVAVFGGAPGRTAVIVAVSVVFFLAWDIVGIATGVFFRGSGPWMTGILLGPELPLEELFFLILLSYSTLVSYLLATRALSRRSAQ